MSNAESHAVNAPVLDGAEEAEPTIGTILQLQAQTNAAIPVTEDIDTDEDHPALTPTKKKRRRRKNSQRRDSKPGDGPSNPDVPSTDHGNILRLPHNVLIAILTHLHPLELYAMSVTCKGLAALLHSRKSISVWATARKRLTVYVPPNFINAKDAHGVPGRVFERLEHYPFSWRSGVRGAAEDTLQTEEQELIDEANNACKLPLSIPEPSLGLSEFALARYLFANICMGCGTAQRERTRNVPELTARFCKSCSANYHHPLKTALLYFESKATSEKFAEVPLYYEFLLAQTYWSGTRQVEEDSTEGPVAPAHRRIFTQPLEQDFIVYQKKRRALSGGDFGVWYQKKLVETEQRRTAAAKLAEYSWLRATYDAYIKRLAPHLDRRERERAR